MGVVRCASTCVRGRHRPGAPRRERGRPPRPHQPGCSGERPGVGTDMQPHSVGVACVCRAAALRHARRTYCMLSLLIILTHTWVGLSCDRTPPSAAAERKDAIFPRPRTTPCLIRSSSVLRLLFYAVVSPLCCASANTNAPPPLPPRTPPIDTPAWRGGVSLCLCWGGVVARPAGSGSVYPRVGWAKLRSKVI